jgi:hypothetical protein
MLNSRLCCSRLHDNLTHFTLNDSKIVVNFIAKETMKLLHLFLDWELDSLRCY